MPDYNLPPELLAFIEALPDDQLDALEQLYRVLAYGPPAEAALSGAGWCQRQRPRTKHDAPQHARVRHRAGPTRQGEAKRQESAKRRQLRREAAKARSAQQEPARP